MENRGKRIVYVIIFSLIFLVYWVRLFQLQLGDKDYERIAINNALNKITLYPSRSNIFDRNGKLIVYSTQIYDLSVFPFEIKKLDTGLLSHILEIPGDEVISRFEEAKVRSQRRQKNNSNNKSTIFYSNLTPKQFAVIRENMFRLKGFFIESRTDRQFASISAPHALGYLGEANEAMLAEDEYYQPGDLVGITGLERYYEAQFRGVKGVKTVWQDRKYEQRGEVKDSQFNYPSIAGPDVTSTLDIDVQNFARELMKENEDQLWLLSQVPAKSLFLLIIRIMTQILWLADNELKLSSNYW